MTLLKLDIRSVRNIQHATLTPSPRINFIYGENASGKSAFLEALFILGRAKSFRSASPKSVIHFGHDHLIVTAQGVTVQEAPLHLGVRMDYKTFSCRINHQSAPNRAGLAYALPLQLIYPKSYELLEAGPQVRREFLDWGVFNHDRAFLPAWRNYKKALLQRNSLIKSKNPQHIHIWDKELAYYGTIVQECRRNYLLQLKPVFIEIFNHFLAIEGIDLKLAAGWDPAEDLSQTLKNDIEKDLRYGFTQSGPHRADLQILINDKPAKDIISRGQLKLLVISLKLAQVRLLANESGDPGCILIDDFAAELDAFNRARLLEHLSAMNCQVFITATEVNEFGDLTALKDYKMFHVEHGNITPV
ncbi:DNA replication/repair protein RecF [Methylosarcina fibrata]|uniref:DNA replication/repair protein RecF n=1 Tax=Methylosarcina fibrata TaxID=105972 RepID=UPI0003622883|nr:DNA replication/repair protein RecF [Methylosarcina fibrata]